MKKRKIVFDVDDVLWGFNERVSEMTGIPMKALVTYNINKNPTLTDKERKKIIDCYGSSETFKRIEWYDGVLDLLKLENNGYEVYINTNSLTDEIGELKRKQLKSVLALSDSRMSFNTISNPEHKSIDDDVYYFVDDSPHNIEKSNAEVNIVINKPWNTSENGVSIMKGKNIVRFDTLRQVLDYLFNKED